jgi:hypothetical protein
VRNQSTQSHTRAGDSVGDIVPAVLFGAALGLLAAIPIPLMVCQTIWTRRWTNWPGIALPDNVAFALSGAWMLVCVSMFVAALMQVIRIARRRLWSRGHLKRGFLTGACIGILVDGLCLYVHAVQ